MESSIRSSSHLFHHLLGGEDLQSSEYSGGLRISHTKLETRETPYLTEKNTQNSFVVSVSLEACALCPCLIALESCGGKNGRKRMYVGRVETRASF